MPYNRQAQKVNSDLSSNQSGDNMEEAIQRMKINDKEDAAAVSYSPYPDRPGQPDCSYYLKTGSCSYGSHCRYNHPPSTSNVRADNYGAKLPERVEEPDCEYFLKTGTCKYGSTCKYHHPKDRGAAPVSFNSVGLPMRRNEKPCPYYMRTESCKFGSSCKFHHPEPVGSILPLISTVGPSSAVPYVGTFPLWSLPRLSYAAGPHGLPVYVSPSQDFLPPQGWNTYMESWASSGIYGPSFVHNPAISSDPSSGGQTNLFSMSNLPQRPDKPACQHFLITGTCMYGSDCKFNHPNKRFAQMLTSPLSFPMRPGQAISSHYRIY